MREIKLQDLKSKTPAELVSFAEENGVENASTMRKQELMFAILKQLAIQETDIIIIRPRQIIGVGRAIAVLHQPSTNVGACRNWGGPKNTCGGSVKES